VLSLALRKLVACTEGIRDCFALDDASPGSFATGVETEGEGSIIRVVRMTKGSVRGRRPRQDRGLRVELVVTEKVEVEGERARGPYFCC
jgi:hypothetical protein